MLWAFSAFAYRFTFEGYAAGKYAIVMEVDRNANGSITGRYAYKSTLNDRGRNNRAAWLYIAPDGNSKTDYIITDSNGKVQEHWSNASFSRSNGVNYFTVNVINAKGRTFTINLHSTTESASNSSSSSTNYDEEQSLAVYFRDKIGRYPSEIGLFIYPKFHSRIIRTAGIPGFSSLCSAFENQTTIAFSNGMYWAFGYKENQSSDNLMALWAYDPESDVLYIWSRYGTTESWKSDVGSISSDFKNLVREKVGIL